MNPQLVTSSHKKFIAFEMRFMGKSFSEIAQAIEANTATISTYFSREWKAEYRRFEVDTLTELRKASSRRLSALNKKAIDVIEGLLDDPESRVRMSAARDVLDRTIGKNDEPSTKESNRKPIQEILEKYGLGEGVDIPKLPTS